MTAWRRAHTYFLPLVVTMAFVAVLAGCGGGGSASKPDRATLVLFDISRSTHGEPRQFYRRAFARIVNAVAGQGGLISADVIDNNPLAHSKLPVQQFFKTYDPVSDNPDDFNAERDDNKAKVEKSADTVIGHSASKGGTAILDALNLAQNYFDSYPSAKHKYLVILSDMVEESNRYRFTKHNLLPAAIQSFIQSEKANGNLPHLEGVQVYVAGAGASGGPHDLDPRRILEVKHFWLTYFTATGADLPGYRYGPDLIQFP